MANIKSGPFKFMPNLIHLLDAFTEDEGVINTIVEINSHTLNKYELITETGHLKLDRVGYSSLSYPFVYGAIPKTWDKDSDPLDVVVVNVTEPLIPGSVCEVRVIGIMKFVDGGEVDDKVIAVLNDDKRVSHIKSVEDLGEYFKTETTYYWEHYKDLKKPGTGKVEGFYDTKEAVKVINECVERYNTEYLPKFNDSCCCGKCMCDNCDCEDCKK